MKIHKSILIPVLLGISFASNAKEKLTIYAASSMTNAVTELVEQFEKQQDVVVTTVFAGSSSLARQLAHGAPADIFISANQKWAQYLVEQGVTKSDNVTNIAANNLVVITAKQNKESLDQSNTDSWLKLLGDSRLAIGQPDAVPAGMYAKESLQSMKLWEPLSDKLAPTNNVRIALALVERQEASLGIVYRTDALLSDKVTILATLPESSHQKITYPMATLNDRQLTEAFNQFVVSQSGKETLAKFGFN